RAAVPGITGSGTSQGLFSRRAAAVPSVGRGGKDRPHSNAAGRARNVPENESILYRGANYELGHGPGFYGIWPAGSPRPPSIEWWPDTPDGWQGAWARYNALEAPGSITMVSPQQQQRQAAGHLGTRALLASGLLAAGI